MRTTASLLADKYQVDFVYKEFVLVASDTHYHYMTKKGGNRFFEKSTWGHNRERILEAFKDCVNMELANKVVEHD